MKKLLFTIVLIVSLCLGAVERIDVLDNDPFPLTHWLSAQEAARWDEIGRDFYETDPPQGPVHNVAEFEKMQGVLVRYPFGIPLNLIAAMSQHALVVTLVSSQSQWNTVQSQYTSNGVNMANTDYLVAATDSYWTRDFGPWFVLDGNGDLGIANFPYNRPRPNDNDVPIEVAEYMDINLFGMNVVHTGGNYMTDGLGISASSDLVYEENTITNNEVNQRMLDYLGIQTYHVVADPNNTYIDHIDCWGKFLDVDKVLIREVPASHAQYDEIEEVADYFASQTSSYGNNYQVYRVYTPNDQPYSNSLILNDHVYVPLTGSQYDDDAIATYEAAMPGYTITGIPSGSAPWESTDALHCRTKGLADPDMLYIYHLPLLDDQPADLPLDINCDITAYSGAEISSQDVLLHYKAGGDQWIEAVMTSQDQTSWTAQIPAQPAGTVVSYYITALDEDDNSACHPFIGEADPHIFYAGGQIDPNLVINPEEYDVHMPSDSVLTLPLELTNTGGGVVSYSIEFSETGRDISGSYVECAQEFFTPGEIIELDFTVYNESPEDEWISDVHLGIPLGFNVLEATDFVGGSGGDLIFGNDLDYTWWHGETASGWGVIHDGESASCTVTVEVDPDFSGNTIINWDITGDGYGSDPHQVFGDIYLNIYGGPVSWISADQLGGELWAMESQTINITFDSTELPQNPYFCFIIINWNGNEELIPVNLTVSSVPVAQDEITAPLNNLVAYPNPFSHNSSRSSISLNFELDQNQSNVTVDVYNIKGQKTAAIYSGALSAGSHQLSWNGCLSSGALAPAGIYLFKISTPNFDATHKTLILK